MIVPSNGEVFTHGSVNAAQDKVTGLLDHSANLMKKHGVVAVYVLANSATEPGSMRSRAEQAVLQDVLDDGLDELLGEYDAVDAGFKRRERLDVKKPGPQFSTNNYAFHHDGGEKEEAATDKNGRRAQLNMPRPTSRRNSGNEETVSNGQGDDETKDNQQIILSKTPMDLSRLTPCSNEEADTRMLLHTVDGISKSFKEILIQTVNTYVVVLVTALNIYLIGCENSWIALGTRKTYHFIGIHARSRKSSEDDRVNEDATPHESPEKKEVVFSAGVPTSTALRYDVVDTTYAYVAFKTSIYEWEKGSTIVKKVAELLKLPFKTFKNIRVDNNEVTFKVGPNAQHLNASEVAKRIVDIKEELHTQTGVEVTSAGIGDKVSQGVKPSTRMSDRTISHVTLILSNVAPTRTIRGIQRNILLILSGAYWTVTTYSLIVTLGDNPKTADPFSWPQEKGIEAVGSRWKKVSSLVTNGLRVEIPAMNTYLTKLPLVHAAGTESEHEMYILVFFMCGMLAAVMVAAAALYLIRRHTRSRDKLNNLTAPDTEASKDYQELCRARMATKSQQDKPEPLHVGQRIASLSRESEGSNNSPSSRSSTSSWSEEPALTNMDISTGHMVLLLSCVCGTLTSVLFVRQQSYMEDHLKNKDRLEQEWVGLCAYEAEPCAITLALKPENANKNRYSDILPYDHARLVLNDLTNISGSDYINASTITDHDPRNPAYIATQGALPHTAPDFWQMVWEQGSVVMVMLTRLTENGNAIDGVGRTGTYCLIDMVLNRMAKGAKEIDIAATLEHIRDQRPQMVRTKQQFEFVLMAVAEEVNAILKSLPPQQQQPSQTPTAQQPQQQPAKQQ
uniref:Uncharacterized protein n=1 Tax=Timema shepardi TaxID=629360 RepID=A0A7R9G0W7_TIMSH|nr:unnamed protein product [Timema shepardi]